MLDIAVHSEDSLFLLATCYFRAGRLNETYNILKGGGLKSAQNRFLMAKCCDKLNKSAEAEIILNGGSVDPRKEQSVDDMVSEFGESASFAFQLLGKNMKARIVDCSDLNLLFNGFILSGSIYGRTDRIAKAQDCDKKALKLNPFLWNSFESLCSRGEHLDPSKVFNVVHLDNFNHCHGVNPIINVVNSSTIG
jgi:anaphase-promoting complex subunit 3